MRRIIVFWDEHYNCIYDEVSERGIFDFGMSKRSVIHSMNANLHLRKGMRGEVNE